MLPDSSLLKRVFYWRVPSYLFLISILTLVGVLYNLKVASRKRIENNSFDIPAQQQNVNHLPKVKFYRNNDFQFTKPLLIAEITETPENLIVLKSAITKQINNEIQLGNAEQVSVFLRKLNEAGAIAINAQDEYNPGSMMKIPVMMTCLKEAMTDKTLLNKKILFARHNEVLPNEIGSVQVLVPGNYYTIRELIEYMIIDSDNDAMGLLYNYLGQEKLNKVFTEFGIKIPSYDSPSFDMSPVEFSRFMFVLYNATYLDARNSELALQILCRAKYNKSVTRNIPKDVHVAHKYGVAYKQSMKYLSESAIVYLADQPYILVIMTKGNNYERQSDVISNISDLVYNSFVN